MFHAAISSTKLVSERSGPWAGFTHIDTYQRDNSIANLLSSSGENSDGIYGSGHSPMAIGVDLHSKAWVNSAHFAETAYEGSSSQAARS
jgi:hypothetical protein